MEKVCEVMDVAEGTMNGFTVNEKKILIANVQGTFYALDAICTHRGGYLPDGKLSGNLVICPVHGTQYDVTTGKVFRNVSTLMKFLTGQATDLKRYDVSVEGDSIFIDI
jgi:nitrite reductase/ring-hydroxylating ferredoxin subunit